jgi:undecaprenyl-phosphate galactose phosphotransferase
MKKKYFYRFIKRTFDILCSIIGVIFLIPLIILIKLAYIFTGDFKTIFYTQDRIGKNGKLIHIFKFRSMIHSEEKKAKLMEETLKDPKFKKEFEEYKKLENDPRVTKVGKILRKTSLDEFPQFLNILIGNMSLIGPRPYLPREKKDMGKYYDAIITVKPGLTGLWQVSGRANTTFKERLVLEKKYAEEYGFIMDIKIFFKTFVAVFKKNGAK